MTLVAAIVLVMAIAASLHLAPHVTRRDIFFGVTVPSAFRSTPVARSVSRRYAWEVWGVALLAAVLLGTSPFPSVSGTMLLTQTAGGFVAFGRARRAVRPHAVAAATTREADLGPPPRLPGGWLGQCGPFVILAMAAAYAAWHWDSIPTRFPTHWNFAGRPDGWTLKSVGGVYRGVGVGFVLCGMMLFTSWAVLHWTRVPRVAGRDGVESRRVRHANLIATLASSYLVALLLTWSTVFAMVSGSPTGERLPLAFRVAPLALVLLGGSAIRLMRRTTVLNDPPVGDTTPDARWILGHLYVNRADPTLFVEKRMGFGYTLNLGNPLAWLVVVVCAIALAIPLLLVP
jgi:uncharacterized membrane protein